MIAGVIACAVLSISPGTGRCAASGDGISAVDTLSVFNDTISVTAADSSSVENIETGKGHWVVLPGFFYTPETGFGGGPIAGYIFPRQVGRHPSSIMGMFFYTEKEQTTISLTSELYTAGGFHGIAELGYQKFPDSFWGIGPDTEDSDEEKYTPEFFQARVVGEIEFLSGLRAGAQFIYRREVMLEREEGGSLEKGIIPGSTGGTTAGAGMIATYDSRDNIFSSATGWYLNLSHASYGNALTSDYGFTGISLDVRKFFTLPRAHVFAVRIFTWSTTGTVPFQDLPALGGGGDMRGYQAGRYRDKFAAYAQAEYRFPFVWVTWLAVFGSIGNVSHSLNDYDFNSVKYTGGGGVRFRLNEERFSIRFDYAVTGEGGSNFYITLNEAF